MQSILLKDNKKSVATNNGHQTKISYGNYSTIDSSCQVGEGMERNFKGIWIPREIWLSEDLGWTEKFLLAEIDSLAKNNECFASNDYFAKFFNISKDRISKVVSGLANKGYVEVNLIYKEGTRQVEKRIITTIGYRRKQLEGIGENNHTPIGENAEDINTSFNNTKEYISYADTVQLTREQYNRLTEEYGKKVVDDYIERLDEWQTNNPRKKKKDHNKTLRVWMKDVKKVNKPQVKETLAGMWGAEIYE